MSIKYFCDSCKEDCTVGENDTYGFQFEFRVPEGRWGQNLKSGQICKRCLNEILRNMGLEEVK